MERISLEGLGIPYAAQRAAEILRTGGAILYPTDTLYGIGADAISSAAVSKVVDIKGRSERKPIHAIVSDVEMATRYGEIPDTVSMLVQKLPKGKITFIVRKHERYDTGILRGPTFGFRIPDNAFCLAMIEAFDGPITATSANKAGERPERDVEGILHQLGENIDLVVDAGELVLSAPSTVLDLSAERPRIVREGAVRVSEIAQYIVLS